MKSFVVTLAGIEGHLEGQLGGWMHGEMVGITI